jgi:hypothetical protein
MIDALRRVGIVRLDDRDIEIAVGHPDGAARAGHGRRILRLLEAEHIDIERGEPVRVRGIDREMSDLGHADLPGGSSRMRANIIEPGLPG